LPDIASPIRLFLPLKLRLHVFAALLCEFTPLLRELRARIHKSFSAFQLLFGEFADVLREFTLLAGKFATGVRTSHLN
jgi:hypothetical protein